MNGIEKIQHLIILMMENRSFDHYLGSLSLPTEGRDDIEGLREPLARVKDKDGNDVACWAMDGIFDVPDPPHGWEAAHADHNAGRNDGFSSARIKKQIQSLIPASQWGTILERLCPSCTNSPMRSPSVIIGSVQSSARPLPRQLDDRPCSFLSEKVMEVLTVRQYNPA